MEGIADYHGDDEASRKQHGLEVGDTVDAGIGDAVTVVEIDSVGVKFDDGQTATHGTVVSNMKDLDLL